MGYTDTATGYYTTYSGYVADDVQVGIAWGCFVAYILGVVLLTYTLDMMRVCDKLIKKLGDSAYAHYNIVSKIHEKEKATKELIHKDVKGQTDVGLAEDASTTKRDSMIEDTIREIIHEEQTGSTKKLKFTATCCNYPDEPYSDAFFASLITDRAHWGCSDVLFKDGKFCCITRPRGFLEDYIFTLFQRHILLSQFGAVRGNPYSREDRRVAFLFLTAFSIMFQILVNYSIDDDKAALAVNILVISPISLFFFGAFYNLEVCPCLAKHLHSKKKLCGLPKAIQCIDPTRGSISTILSRIGKSIAYPLAIFALCFLLIASYFGGVYGASGTTNYIKKNAYSVFLSTNGLDFIYLSVQFLNGRKGYNFHILGFSFSNLGKWFMQYIDDRMLKEGEEYDVSVDKNCNFRSNHLCGVVIYSANNNTFFSLFGHHLSEEADLLIEELAAIEAEDKLNEVVSVRMEKKKHRVKGWMRIARWLSPNRAKASKQQESLDDSADASTSAEVGMTAEEVLESGGAVESGPEETAVDTVVNESDESSVSPEKPSLFKQLSSLFVRPADSEDMEMAMKTEPEDDIAEPVASAPAESSPARQASPAPCEEIRAPAEEEEVPAPAPAPGIFKQLSSFLGVSPAAEAEPQSDVAPEGSAHGEEIRAPAEEEEVSAPAPAPGIFKQLSSFLGMSPAAEAEPQSDVAPEGSRTASQAEPPVEPQPYP